MNRQTEVQANRRMDRQRYKWTDEWTDRGTNKQPNGQTEVQTCRQMYRSKPNMRMLNYFQFSVGRASDQKRSGLMFQFNFRFLFFLFQKENWENKNSFSDCFVHWEMLSFWFQWNELIEWILFSIQNQRKNYLKTKTTGPTVPYMTAFVFTDGEKRIFTFSFQRLLCRNGFINSAGILWDWISFKDNLMWF